MDQAVADFEDSLHSIWSDSLGYLCLITTISDNYKLQLAPSIKPHKLLCNARGLLLFILPLD